MIIKKSLNEILSEYAIWSKARLVEQIQAQNTPGWGAEASMLSLSILPLFVCFAVLCLAAAVRSPDLASTYIFHPWSLVGHVFATEFEVSKNALHHLDRELPSKR